MSTNTFLLSSDIFLVFLVYYKGNHVVLLQWKYNMLPITTAVKKYFFCIHSYDKCRYFVCAYLRIYWRQPKDWHIKTEAEKPSLLLVPVLGILNKKSRRWHEKTERVRFPVFFKQNTRDTTWVRLVTQKL